MIFYISQILKYWEIPERFYESCRSLPGFNHHNLTGKFDIKWKSDILGKMKIYIFSFKIALVVVKLTDFSLGKFDQQEISLQQMLRYWVLKNPKNIEVRIVIEHKNDTNAPAVLDMWVSEVGPWLGQRVKETGNKQQRSLISIYIFIMGSPKLFRLAIFSLTNLNGNDNYQISIKK